MILETSTIGGRTMRWWCHIFILDRVRDTASMILTRLATIDVRVVIVLLSSGPRHHLIVLIHLILVWIIATSAHLRVLWVTTLGVLIAEPH